MLNRPHRLYILVAIALITLVFIPNTAARVSIGTGCFIFAILAAFYFQYSTREFAGRLLARVQAGDESARRLYLARTRSGLGDIAREYLNTLLSADDERLLPLVVKQLGHPDVQAREMTEDRLARWGAKAADPVVRAALGQELTGDGAFRARRLLYRWRPELPSNLASLLEAGGYWQEA